MNYFYYYYNYFLLIFGLVGGTILCWITGRRGVGVGWRLFMDNTKILSNDLNNCIDVIVILLKFENICSVWWYSTILKLV